MDIAFIASRKEKLERDIVNSIYSLVSEFESDTGITPDNISIYFQEVSKLSEERKRHIVSGVDVEIRL